MNTKIKILHLIPRFEVGGAEMLVWHYSRLMNDEDFEIAVGSCVADGAFRAEFEKLGIKVFVGSRDQMKGRLGVGRELKKFIAEWQPDIIHTHLMASDLFGYLTKNRSKGKIIWISTQHNVEFNTSLLRRLLWRLILPKADKVIAVAQKVQKYCMDNFGVQAEKVVTILNGIDLEPWLQVDSTHLFAGDKLRIASIGRLEKQKGHIYLLRALAQLKEINWSWDIFGDGSKRQELEAAAKRYHINDRIVWHGVTSKAYEQFNNIDLVVQPSLWEGLSLVMMECMAAGKAVLATKIAGEELIDNGHTGMLVPAGDVGALKDALEYFYSHPEVGRELGERARAQARDNFGIEKNVAKISDVYKTLAI